jgi:IS5 family transposase
MRKFMGINFFEQDVPDATTLLHFRHLLRQSPRSPAFLLFLKNKLGK